MSSSNKTILVTGASGYVAAHIIKIFLEAGYRVRGTIRSESSIQRIKDAHGDLAKNLDFAIVKDITTPHAFDEAVRGVIGIIATASPFDLKATDFENELLKPAIAGVINLLESAATAAGPQLKRVVLTASFASNLDLSQGYRPGYTYTEADWNPATFEEAAASDSSAFAYCASKGLAEKAGWDWVAKNKPSFEFTALNPPWVFGPSVNAITNLDKLNESTEAIWHLVNGSRKEPPPNDFLGFVNAEDLGKAHLLAFENDGAAGERFIIGSHFDYQTAIDILRDEFPQLKDRIPAGERGAGERSGGYQLNASKVKNVLGIELTSLRDTLIATVNGLLEAEKRTGWGSK